MVRVCVISVAIAAGTMSGPVRAADLESRGSAVVVHSAPFVVYDFEPGIVARAYWVEPWEGRHYFPSGGKLPVLGRREEIGPAPVTGKRNFYREWSSFPVDTIQQPPLILNQQQYFPHATPTPAPVTPELSK